MATLDLANSAIDRVRMNVADTLDIAILPDSAYAYLLDELNGNEIAATKKAAGWILGQLAHNTRERLDRIEVYGHQQFEQYLKFLKTVVNNPAGGYALAGVYAAGIDVEDVLANQADTEIVQRRLPIGGEDGEYSALSDPIYGN